MRKLYFRKRSNARRIGQSISKLSQLIILIVIVAFTANSSIAQVTMTWTGAENTRFDNENNWDPAGSIIGNILNIPALYDTLGIQLYANLPILTGSTNYTVKEINVIFDKTLPALQSNYTINLDNNTDTLILDNGSAIQYGSTGIIINKGTVLFNSYKRFDEVGTNMIVNGGEVYFKRYLIMRNGNNMATGGHITMTGGKVRMNAGFHDRVNKTMNQWTITGDAVLEVVGNYGSTEADITSGWMSGGADYSVLRSYDPIANVTTYSAVPSSSFLIANSDRQVVVANTPGNALNMILTGRVTNATSLTWKYRKQGETNYTSFANASDSASFVPVFPNSGVFYVICEGIDALGATVQSQEVEFFVGSDAITIFPLFSIQYTRPNEKGTQLNATFTGTASAMEWKYSETPSGPYISFDPQATAAKFVPSFNSTGSYYVVLEATIGGEKHTSFEMFYVVEDAASSGKSITWTGLISDDATDPGNWSPVASPFKNSIIVNGLPSTYITNEAGDTIDIIKPRYPVYTNTGNDTISHMGVYTPGELTFDGPDTVFFSGSGSQPYITGNLYLKKGTLLAKSWDDLTIRNVYWNFHAATDTIIVSGNASMRLNVLLFGNKALTDGGHLFLKDNATFYVTNLDRVVADTLESVIYISDNAMFLQADDVRNTIVSRIEAGKIVCPQEGYEPYVLFDGVYTIVKARNTNAFAIENDAKTYTTANYPVEVAIGLTNVDGVTSWEWKYSENINGPWISFSPAATDLATFNPTFTESGTYYVVAETSDGQITSNLKPVVVIDLGMTPDDAQFIDLNTDGVQLQAIVPSEFVVTAFAWYYREQGSEEYFQTGVEDSVYTPNFSVRGVYEIFYGIEVQDEFGIQYFLQSSSVTITAGNVGVDEFKLNALKIYPNPTSGKFFIEGNLENDYTLEILNLAGSVLDRQFVPAGNKQAINFAGKGVYIVKLTSNNNIKVGRLIVQ